MNLAIKSEVLIPSEGDKRLQALKTCLERLDKSEYRRTAAQKRWHSSWTQACLSRIYGKDFEAKVPSLSTKFGTTPPFFRNVITRGTCMTGKKTGLCMFLAAYLWTQKSASVVIITPAVRHSDKLIKVILRLLPFILPDDQDASDIVLQKNHSRLCLQGADGTKCVFNTLPEQDSCLYGLKDADIFIAYKPELFRDLYDFQRTVNVFMTSKDYIFWIISNVGTCQTQNICLEFMLDKNFAVVKSMKAKRNQGGANCVLCDFCFAVYPSGTMTDDMQKVKKLFMLATGFQGLVFK